jgi:hypothetical protein
LIDWCLTPISAVFQLYRGITIMGYQYKTGMLIKQFKKKPIHWHGIKMVLPLISL